MLIQQVMHPMVKFQRKVKSLVDSNVIQSSERLWKISFLYGDEWSHWKQELEEFGFTMQDSIKDLLIVETWEEEED